MKKSLKSIPHSDSPEREDGSIEDASDKIDGKIPQNPKVSVYFPILCFPFFPLKICTKVSNNSFHTLAIINNP